MESGGAVETGDSSCTTISMENDNYLFEKGDVFGAYVVDERVFSNRCADIQQYLVHDKDTCACFVLIAGWVRAVGGGGWTFSVTPRYNADGTVMRREDILKELDEEKVKIREREESKKKFVKDLTIRNIPRGGKKKSHEPHA